MLRGYRRVDPGHATMSRFLQMVSAIGVDPSRRSLIASDTDLRTGGDVPMGRAARDKQRRPSPELPVALSDGAAVRRWPPLVASESVMFTVQRGVAQRG